MDSGPPLLSTEDVRRLERLTISSLDAIEAGLIGQREGPRRSATGVEFAEHRRYGPGDDLRRIDWNAYGRIGELLVKTAPDKARVWLSILLDTSRSMDHGEPTKLHYGRRLAALLGAVALLRSDSVQVRVLSDGESVAGGRVDAVGMLGVLASEVQRLPAGRGTELARSIAHAGLVGERSELVALVSDCLVASDDLAAALSQLARSSRSAVLLHVLDPRDAIAGPIGDFELRDRETDEERRTRVTEQLQLRYAERYAEFRSQTEARCRTAGVHYVPATTSVDPLELLFEIARTGALVRQGSVN
jgi:uncharacterized protein (DUF58 family)